MQYTPIDPRVIDFDPRDPAAAKQYNAWFHANLASRVQVLAGAIASTVGFEDWVPDETRRSLEALDVWLREHVETRPRTEAEIAEIESKLRFPVRIEPLVLSDWTNSVCTDVGMYLSLVVLRTIAGTKWGRVERNPRSGDCGQPAIRGFGKVVMTPVEIAMVVATHYSDGRTDRSAPVGLSRYLDRNGRPVMTARRMRAVRSTEIGLVANRQGWGSQRYSLPRTGVGSLQR